MADKREAGLAESLALIVVALGAAAFQAFALFKIWSWFIVPLGVVSVPVAAFVGISCIISILSFRPPPEKDAVTHSADYRWALVLGVVLLSAISLGTSYLALVFL